MRCLMLPNFCLAHGLGLVRGRGRGLSTKNQAPTIAEEILKTFLPICCFRFRPP